MPVPWLIPLLGLLGTAASTGMNMAQSKKQEEAAKRAGEFNADARIRTGMEQMGELRYLGGISGIETDYRGAGKSGLERWEIESLTLAAEGKRRGKSGKIHSDVPASRQEEARAKLAEFNPDATDTFGRLLQTTEQAIAQDVLAIKENARSLSDSYKLQTASYTAQFFTQLAAGASELHFAATRPPMPTE